MDVRAILRHLGGFLALINLEVETVLLENLDRALCGETLEHVGDLAGSARENLEFSALDEEVIPGKFLNESLQKGASLFDKPLVGVTRQVPVDGVATLLVKTNGLLLGDAGNIASGPSLEQDSSKSVELVVSALHFKGTL